MGGALLKAKKRKPLPRKAWAAKSKPFPVVGIGASAGGLEAFSELLRHLPVASGTALVLVQHLDPKHPSELCAILSRTTSIPVTEVTNGTRVQANHVYVIPPNTNLVIEKGALRLAARVLTHGQYLPVDHFLCSLAQDCGNLAISVILSGTASDGTEGSRAVKEAGGITFVQDAQSAKYPGMPQSAVAAGCVDFVLPPAEIAGELARIGKHPYLRPASPENPETAIIPSDGMEDLLGILRQATGVDFTHYKPTTLQRRIGRRMILRQMEKLTDYIRYLRNHPEEIEELYQDILVHVTGFFRDPDAFEALRKHVFPHLFPDDKNSTVRVWVPGCSTGEEVYSLAMSMLEHLWLETQKTAKASLGAIPFQIFATDISDNSLDHARAGLYSQAQVAGISPERLRRFFVPLDGGYQIAKSVREMCIFAKQNVAKDPPFSHLDLISCRNLLIYLGPVLQKRVIPTLHYALNPNRYLLLGGSETLGSFAEYFIPVDRKNKIYQKKKSATRLITQFGAIDYGIRRAEDAKILREPQAVFTVEKEVDRLLANHFVPASIVVNDDMEIVQFRGKTGAYLEPATGQPTFSASRMAREGLLVDLRSAVAKARKQNAAVRREGVRIRSNGGSKEINLEVIPLRGASSSDRFYVVVFQDAVKKPIEATTASAPRNATSRDHARLRRETAQLREQFQALVEEHETTTEEYKSANEEVLSANEELQSTNEELETAREELQSTNEELTTLNEEFQNHNAELTAVNNDLLNLLDNVTMPVVIVNHDLLIRRFTPPAQKLLNLLPTDVGRPLTEIRPNLDGSDIGPLARRTIESVTVQELEMRENENGHWHLMRLRPYKTSDGRIDGAVISFQDIDAIKRNLDHSRVYADSVIENAREAILVLDGNLRVVSANRMFYRSFGASQKETEGSAIYDLGNGQWNIPQLRVLLEHVLPNNERVEDFEVRHNFPAMGERVMMLNGRRIEPQSGRQLILLYIEDLTRKPNP